MEVTMKQFLILFIVVGQILVLGLQAQARTQAENSLPTIASNDLSSITHLEYKPQERSENLFACANEYVKRFKTPGELNIAVAFGYSDTTDEGFNLVTDQWTMKSLAQLLTGPCQYSSQGFCEFNRISSEPHEIQQYTRNLNITVDGTEQTITVNVLMMNSSYDGSHVDNLTTYKKEQLIKSEKAQTFYGWAIKNADVVFYEGHSRDGGGPDFLPPRPASSGKVNYPWYRKNQPGLHFLLSQLEQTETKPMLFGLFSCASQLHFKRKLSPYFTATTSVMSTKVVQARFTKEALFYSMESLLNFECNDSLATRLRGTSFVVNRAF